MSDKPTASQAAAARATSSPGPVGRMANAGMPVEKSENFKASAKRLASRLSPERSKVVLVMVLAVTATALSVIGPKILGRATNLVFSGLRSPSGVDFPQLHRVLLVAIALFFGSSLLG